MYAQKHHIERARAFHKDRMYKSVRIVYALLTDEWLHIKDVVELLAKQNVVLSVNTIRNYIKNDSFAEINLSVEFQGLTHLRLKN